MTQDRPVTVFVNDDGVLTATLNRPDVRNALVADLEEGLREAIAAASSPDVRAVVLTGSGPVFCAGANTKELEGNDRRDEAALRLRAREIPETVLLPLARLEKPVVAALNGPAVGAGIGLALAADFRVLASSASFVFAFQRVALVPDLGTCWFLQRLLGNRIARDLVMRPRTITAADALALGLADDVVRDDGLVDAAGALAAGPTLAVGLAKTLLRRAPELSLEAFLEQEVLAQSALVRSADHAEGVRALAQRHAPDFTGR